MANYDVTLQVTPTPGAEIQLETSPGSGVSESNAEAWAVGRRGGVDVPSTDPTYHNNSKYYAQQADEDAQTASGAKDDAIDAKDDAEAARDAAQSAAAHYPYVDPTTGNWMVWDPSTSAWVDTGYSAVGPTGAVPNIQIGTVTKLSPGSTPTVTRRSGSPDTAPILDFGLVTGDTGSAANVFGTTVPMSEQDSTKVKDAIDGKANANHTHADKADKVSGGTADNFAALDANGNLKDSGKKASDFLTNHQDISGKADKVQNGTENNFAALDANGNLKDSGKKASDFLTNHQDISGKADKVQNGTENNFAGLDSSGNLKDSGKKASDFAEAAAGLPTGGTQAQFLMKTSGTNYAASWVTPDSVPGMNPDNVVKSGAVKTVKDSADLALDSIAGTYDPTATYKEGNLCFYEISGTTYLMRCKGTTTGSFDPTKWEQKDIGYAIQKVQENLDGLIDDTAGSGDEDVTLSADKIMDELGDRDTAIAAVAGSVSIPVNGNTAPAAIASGKYIYLTGHSTLADGEYITTAAIAASESITSSNVDPVSDGAANDLNSKITVRELTGWTKGSQVTDASKLHLFVLNEKVLLIIGQFTTNQTGTGNQTILTLPSGMSFSTAVDRQDIALGVDCYALSGRNYVSSSAALTSGTKYIRNAYMLLD